MNNDTDAHGLPICPLCKGSIQPREAVMWVSKDDNRVAHAFCDISQVERLASRPRLSPSDP